MSQRWRAIQHVSLSPATTIGDIVKSALVLTQFGSCASFVMGLPRVKDHAFAEQREACAAVHLAFDHLDLSVE
jgi:hypothetical protein